jgi:hypothetical protein
MSYYNFDEHFWSAQTVCSKAGLPKSNPKNLRTYVLRVILALACVGIWIPLLFSILVPTPNEYQEKSSLSGDNSGFHRLLLKRAILNTQQ